MNFPTGLEWNQPGLEPPQKKKDEGWLPEEKPSAEFFNWFFNRICQSVNFLNENKVGKEDDVLQNSWKLNKPYKIGDICYSTTADSYKRFECVVSGTSGITEPTWPNVGQMVTDGTVKWIVDDIRDGALPGDIALPSMIVRLGRVKLDGRIVNRADFPRLAKFANDNNLITSEANWAAGLSGLFGAGDGTTTLRLPDLRGEHIRFLDDGRGVDKTNITGNTTNGSATITNITSAVTLAMGMPISGNGIPVGATIASIISSTSITISANATATIAGVTLTITGRVLGSAEADVFQTHYHKFRSGVGSISNGVYGAGFPSYGENSTLVREPISDGIDTLRTGPETRGRNIAYYATMKY